MESEEELQKEALSLIERIDPELIYTLRTRISLIREGEPVYRLCSRTKKKERYDPTCSLLDAALYIRKWEATNREGMCITILPDVYKRQQDTTKLILNNAGLDIPIMNVYFNEGEDVILEKNFEAYRIPLEISLLKTEFAFDFY